MFFFLFPHSDREPGPERGGPVPGARQRAGGEGPQGEVPQGEGLSHPVQG